MKLVLSEEEQFLKDTAKSFVEERSPISHFRSLRDDSDPLLWNKDIYSEMVKLGWPGILIPCLLYTSPSPRDCLLSRMPSSA